MYFLIINRLYKDFFFFGLFVFKCRIPWGKKEKELKIS